MSRSKNILGILSYFFAALFLLYEMALQVSPSIMVKDLIKDFSLTATMLGLMSSFYFYSYSFMQIPVGLLFDKFNAKALIVIATLVCAFGALFFAQAPTFILASVGRFCMGFGSAFAFVGVLTVADRWFHAKHFALLVGLAQFLAAVGAWGGAYPLAVWLNKAGWRPMIMSMAILGMVLALLNLIFIKDHPEKQRVKKPVHHLLKELKQLLKNPQIYLLFVYAFCAWGPVTVLPALWAPTYLQTRFEVSHADAALSSGMIWFGIALSAPLIGYFSDKVGRRKPFIAWPAFIGLVGSILLFYVPGMSFKATYVLFFIIGVASGANILSFALSRENNKPSVVSTGIGLNNMGVVVGGAILQPVVGKIIQSFWDGATTLSGAPIYNVADFTWGMSVVPLCFFVGLIASLCVKETYCRSIHQN